MKIEAITLKNHGRLTALPGTDTVERETAPETPKPQTPRRDEFAGKAAARSHKKRPPQFKKKIIQDNEPAADGTPKEQKNWTLLCYFAADCNLEEYAVRDLLDLQRVGSTQNMNILTQIDRGETPSIKKYGGKPGATRYYVNQSLNRKIDCQEVENLGQINMSDAKELKDFVSWGMKSYPAKNYVVLMFGHGGGVLGMSTDEGAQKMDPQTLAKFLMADKKSGFDQDEWAISLAGENPEIIKPREMEKALREAEAEAGVNKEQVILGLKSCQMGQTENAYQWKDAANVLLASQSVIYTDSWRMNEIFGKPAAGMYDQKQMAEHIFKLNDTPLTNQYGMIIKNRITTAALVDLSKAGELKPAVLKLEKAIKNSDTDPAKIKELLEIKSRPGFFTNTWVVHYASDFYEAAGLLASDPEIKDPEIKKAANQLIGTLNRVVVKSSHRDQLEYDKNSNGLGLTTLSDPQTLERAEYGDLAFDKDTGWSEFLTSYSRGVTFEAMDQRLSGTEEAFPQLQKMADFANKHLDNYEPVQKEIAEAKEEIARIKASPDLAPQDKSMESVIQVVNIGAFKNLSTINYQVMSERQQEIMNGVFTTALLAGAGNHLALEPIIRTMLLVTSALDGKINTETLGKAADKLNAEVGAAEKRLSPTTRKLVAEYQQEKNREKKGELLKQLDAAGSDALTVAVMPDKGAEFLTILGYATRNERIVNLKNFKGEAPKEFLAALSGLKTAEPEKETVSA